MIDAGNADVRAAPAFAHASEAEMARILDFYDVRWHYEPDTFPILWNLDGDVVESFSPDFWLPDLGLYLELTTLKQRLVRKKNRKLRRLRELYPDIRIKLFYARDFRALMLKYGKFGVVDALSGTAGQMGGPEEPLLADETAAMAAVAVSGLVASLDAASVLAPEPDRSAARTAPAVEPAVVADRASVEPIAIAAALEASSPPIDRPSAAARRRARRRAARRRVDERAAPSVEA
jgi:hypothetical protein